MCCKRSGNCQNQRTQHIWTIQFAKLIMRVKLWFLSQPAKTLILGPKQHATHCLFKHGGQHKEFPTGHNTYMCYGIKVRLSCLWGKIWDGLFSFTFSEMCVCEACFDKCAQSLSKSHKTHFVIFLPRYYSIHCFQINTKYRYYAIVKYPRDTLFNVSRL